jgi:hypothetical protein
MHFARVALPPRRLHTHVITDRRGAAACVRSRGEALLLQSRVRPPAPRRTHRRVVALEGGMYVPNDSFGGVSPERKAADALRQLFTFVAVR